ncbi:YebO family protein [Lelliottia amnigena]|uniref:YebO family protein n=1 Tax=Lelliottia amnigena TaxID=61646 RepID=UPI0021D9C96C|nr:YebO family protein [Lelliottia amnigena]MCU7784291.1 YebO family protein [Lelliottia amnigena]
MGELQNSGLLNVASLAMFAIIMVIGLVLWFFMNRASSRTNEQIELLEALLDQQKRQNALLRRLCEANEPEEKPTAKAPEAVAAEDEDDFIRLVAER